MTHLRACATLASMLAASGGCDLGSRSIGSPNDTDAPRLDVGGGEDETGASASASSSGSSASGATAAESAGDEGARLDVGGGSAESGSGGDSGDEEGGFRLDVAVPDCDPGPAPWCLLCSDDDVCGRPCSLEGAECVSDRIDGTRTVCEAGLWTCDLPAETPAPEGECACAADSSPAGSCVARPPSFPDFPRDCTMDEQCAIAFHTVDCCGSEHAWGIRTEDVERFAAHEALCDAQYPGCECAARPTETDTGQTTSDHAAIAVSCVTGLCTTAVM